MHQGNGNARAARQDAGGCAQACKSSQTKAQPERHSEGCTTKAAQRYRLKAKTLQFRFSSGGATLRFWLCCVFRDSSKNGAGPDSSVSSIIPSKRRSLNPRYLGQCLVRGDLMVCLLPGCQGLTVDFCFQKVSLLFSFDFIAFIERF